jgi:hypothetical protein
MKMTNSNCQWLEEVIVQGSERFEAFLAQDVNVATGWFESLGADEGPKEE